MTPISHTRNRVFYKHPPRNVHQVLHSVVKEHSRISHSPIESTVKNELVEFTYLIIGEHLNIDENVSMHYVLKISAMSFDLISIDVTLWRVVHKSY